MSDIQWPLVMNKKLKAPFLGKFDTSSSEKSLDKAVKPVLMWRDVDVVEDFESDKVDEEKTAEYYKDKKRRRWQKIKSSEKLCILDAAKGFDCEGKEAKTGIGVGVVDGGQTSKYALLKIEKRPDATGTMQTQVDVSLVGTLFQFKRTAKSSQISLDSVNQAFEFQEKKKKETAQGYKSISLAHDRIEAEKEKASKRQNKKIDIFVKAPEEIARQNARLERLRAESAFGFDQGGEKLAKKLPKFSMLNPKFNPVTCGEDDRDDEMGLLDRGVDLKEQVDRNDLLEHQNMFGNKHDYNDSDNEMEEEEEEEEGAGVKKEVLGLGPTNLSFITLQRQLAEAESKVMEEGLASTGQSGTQKKRKRDGDGDNDDIRTRADSPEDSNADGDSPRSSSLGRGQGRELTQADIYSFMLALPGGKVALKDLHREFKRVIKKMNGENKDSGNKLFKQIVSKIMVQENDTIMGTVWKLK